MGVQVKITTASTTVPRPELIPVTRGYSCEPPFVRRAAEGRTEFTHLCGDLFERSTVTVELPIGDGGWKWTEHGDLRPSIYCRTCGLVGSWTSLGTWKPS